MGVALGQPQHRMVQMLLVLVLLLLHQQQHRT
jgi:hypothetical protein